MTAPTLIVPTLTDFNLQIFDQIKEDLTFMQYELSYEVDDDFYDKVYINAIIKVNKSVDVELFLSCKLKDNFYKFKQHHKFAFTEFIKSDIIKTLNESTVKECA